MAYTTINKSTDYFRIKTYTGDSTDNRSITWDETGTNFGTNLLLWLKQRTLASQEHHLSDSVRGVSKFLESDTNNPEANNTANAAYLTNGFVVDNSARTNRGTMVGWGWNTSGSASSNTDGSISSNVSANTTAGFSIVTWTGTGANATVGHGLGAKPEMIIVKNYSASQNWCVYHSGLSGTEGHKTLYLDLAQEEADQTGLWNDTAATSSVFSVGTNTNTNGSSASMIAYCFAEKTGYSKFGSYTGNGNADGTFVYTGFKPAFVLTKTASAAYHWTINDNKRNTFNPVDKRLYPSQNGAEATSDSYDVDFLSNGFKIRSSSVSFNNSGDNVIYMAFAEAPLVGSNNIPCTAR